MIQYLFPEDYVELEEQQSNNYTLQTRKIGARISYGLMI